jgi:hypothetical protein
MIETDLAGFRRILESLPERVTAAQHQGIARGVEIIADEAKREIGHYQEAAGPFVEWAELADSTKADRRRLGFPDDYPLLRSGELHDSIQHTASGDHGEAGSNSDTAVWQELGTHPAGQLLAGSGADYHIPPRSFLGGAAFRMASRVVEQLAGRVIWALRGLPTRND